MQRFVVLALLSILFVGGCSPEITGNEVSEELHESGIKASVYFCPRDNCTDIMKNEIGSSKVSLHCAFYELNSPEIIVAIARKSHEADAKVVIDKDNYENQIKGNIKLATTRQYMHNKFCIIDKERVITGSTNPTKNDLTLNNNNLVIIKSRYIAENYEDEFDELWNGIYNSGEKVKNSRVDSEGISIENYFCPDDDCTEKVVYALKKAEKSIYFMTFSFTEEKIADAMLMGKADIKGVFENRGSGTEYSQYGRLKGFGIDVVKDKNPRTMHHKVFIIDNKTVITGSFNPTGSANSVNDENLVIIENNEIAGKFLTEFESLRQ